MERSVMNEKELTAAIRRHCKGCPDCQADYSCQTFDKLKNLRDVIANKDERYRALEETQTLFDRAMIE